MRNNNGNDIELFLEIRDRLSAIEVKLAKYNALLAEHIKRTELLEKDVAPIKRHVYMLQGGASLLGLLALIAAIWSAINV
jgi:hypothetical protein